MGGRIQLNLLKVCTRNVSCNSSILPHPTYIYLYLYFYRRFKVQLCIDISILDPIASTNSPPVRAAAAGGCELAFEILDCVLQRQPPPHLGPAVRCRVNVQWSSLEIELSIMASFKWRSPRRFVITENAPTRAFTFKTLCYTDTDPMVSRHEIGTPTQLS